MKSYEILFTCTLFSFYHILQQTYNSFPVYIFHRFYWDKQQQQQQHQPRTMGHPYGSVDSVGSSRCYCCHRDAIHTYVYVMNNARIISFSNVLSIQDMKKVTVRIENPSLPSVILKTYELHYQSQYGSHVGQKDDNDKKNHVLIEHASCVKNNINNNKNK